MMQCFYWGVNYIGTIRLNRKGLEGKEENQKPFSDLKKVLKKDYDEKTGAIEGRYIVKKGQKKYIQGFQKGYFEIKKLEGLPICVNVQKDNKVMTEASNAISMEEKTWITRYNKEKNRKESIQVSLGHALINLINGLLDQATA